MAKTVDGEWLTCFEVQAESAVDESNAKGEECRQIGSVDGAGCRLLAALSDDAQMDKELSHVEMKRCQKRA